MRSIFKFTAGIIVGGIVCYFGMPEKIVIEKQTERVENIAYQILAFDKWKDNNRCNPLHVQNTHT